MIFVSYSTVSLGFLHGNADGVDDTSSLNTLMHPLAQRPEVHLELDLRNSESHFSRAQHNRNIGYLPAAFIINKIVF